jgi:hypothetical protein
MRYRKRRFKSWSISTEEQKERGQNNLKKLHLMVAPLLAGEASNQENEWLQKSANMVLNEPYKLSEKWIKSLNKWALKKMKTMSLDDPEYKHGQRYNFENCIVQTVKPPNNEHAYPSYALICSDQNGWKYYFKSSKISKFEEGDIISFSAVVKSSKEGITFLSRASKITVVLQNG